MEDEFSTLPGWTAEAVDALGAQYAVPAACRGSGTPEALRWLCRTMGLTAGLRLLDSGAGEGGPAELAAREYAVSPTLVDPMHGACAAALRMFNRPTLVADGGRLPFGDDVFDAAWSIGVLCTVPDKRRVLSELHRVVHPGSPVGLLVFVRTVDVLPEAPDGNDFPDRAELQTLMDGARLDVIEEARLCDFPDPPKAWQEQVDEVDRVIEQAHRDDERFRRAQEQQGIIGRLLAEGLVQGHLLTASAR
jgi:ubiquinone/menaquinone biosynthesis C-methylase UbiE